MLRNPTKTAIIAIAAVVLLAAAALVTSVGTAHAQLDKDQQKCLNSINKDGAKVAATQGKENSSCIKSAGGEKLGATTADECLTADAKGKVGKAEGKVIATEASRCQGPGLPTFGLTSAAAVNAAAVGSELDLTTTVYGAVVDNAILTDKDGAKCQAGVTKAYEKYASTVLKGFLGCKKSGLKDATIIDAATLASSCVFPPDTKGKVGKAEDKIAAAVAKCATDVATAFPGDCTGAAGDSVTMGACLAAAAGCRMCEYVRAADGLDAGCDAADNGMLDGTCDQCGNGFTEGTEECDDGGSNSDVTPDACRTSCALPSCGDGVIDSGEDCDDSGESPTCNSDCTTAVCGDGKLNVSAGEECDDGNLVDDDFCANDCTRPPQASECPDRGDLVIYAQARSTTCLTNTDCEVGGVQVGECDLGIGRCRTVSKLDTGWTGIAHGQDINDEILGKGFLYCPGPFDGLDPEPCGDCQVEGVDTDAGFCRCSNDNQTLCTDKFNLDTGSCGVAASCNTDADCKVCSVNTDISCNLDEDCPLGMSGGEVCLNGLLQPTCSAGQCVGTCDCYFGPPLPLSAGNTPACAVNKFAQDISGTANVDSGTGELSARLKATVYLGELVTVPCPYCEGDITVNDGVRDGTCVLGNNAGDACDSQAPNETFPSPTGGGHTLDCFPSVGKNVSGLGLSINLDATTGSSSLTAGIVCGFSFSPEVCQCGVCGIGVGMAAEVTGEVCTSNADCLDKGLAGHDCRQLGEGNPKANQCTDSVCTDTGGGLTGECLGGPINTFCDGVLRANGDPFVSCNSNGDCDSTECGSGVGPDLCGDCTLSLTRQCFLPTITATGTPDPEAPVGVATFCIPATSNVAINGVTGLPGPARVINQSRATSFCASDPGTEYVPGVGGCP